MWKESQREEAGSGKGGRPPSLALEHQADWGVTSIIHSRSILEGLAL